jgi:hypothetical protein
MKIIGFVYEIDATCINVRAFGLGAFQKKQKHVPEDPVFGTRYYLCFFIFFFDGSPWYQMQPKKIWKIFWPQKRGFSTGLNTQKKDFFEFFS